MAEELSWATYFNAIIQLLEDADRQYGLANQQYTSYVLENLEMAVYTCRIVRAQMEADGNLGYIELLYELLLCQSGTYGSNTKIS